MSDNACSKSLLRRLVARELDAKGAAALCVEDVIAQLRAALPDRHLNDAELTHLIAEAAARRSRGPAPLGRLTAHDAARAA